MMFWKTREFNIVYSQIKDRQKLYFGILGALISAGITAFIPYIYGRLVDIAIAPNSQTKIILGLIFLWLVLSVLADWLDRYSSRQSYEVAISVNNSLYVNLFYHLSILPLKFHKERKMGKVLRRIDRGLDDIYRLMEETIFSFLPDVFSFLIAIIILFIVEWQLSLILLASTMAYVLVTIFYTKNIIKKQKEMHRNWEKSYGDLWDSVLNTETVKASTNEDFERRRNRQNFSRAERVFNDWRLIWQEMGFWQKLIFSLGFIGIFSAGIAMLRFGLLTPGKLIMFVGYTSLLTSPLSHLAQQYRMAKSAVYSFRRAMKYFDVLPEKDYPDSLEIKDFKGKVVFEKVSFGYKKERPVIRNISFKVEPGETVALVGESGVGKSTLIGLIGRYYLPNAGRILIDDIDIKKINLRFLRGKIGVVPQEVLLFNDTVKNNIRYGRIDATDKEIVIAAKAANAHEFIEKFPRGYNQFVGERGIKLSTGQKQRVAIARAVLRDPKILILDEATSALDSISERLVQEALKKLISSRTTFIIAHRLSTIQHADKIIVLEKGKIAEMGNHRELMKNPKGIYRNFWELQTAIQKVG
jgi:ABC-type multidrug transport system fused ATPase/permease subunit